MEAINLDDMDQSDLYLFVKQTQGVQTRKKAEELGTTPTVVKSLHEYAWNKTASISCRKRGDIEEALMYEEICQGIYDSLPANMKW